MKTLLLLRHAKSSWKDSTQADYDRPLNHRGRDSAILVRRFLKDRKLRPTLVLSSPALRTRQTVASVFEGSSPEIRYDDGLYLASVGKLLEVISRVEGNCDQVVVVGHNPGLEELLFRLTGVDQRFPTAALASIALDIDQWPAIFEARGQLDWFVTPKQLAIS